MQLLCIEANLARVLFWALVYSSGIYLVYSNSQTQTSKLANSQALALLSQAAFPFVCHPCPGSTPRLHVLITTNGDCTVTCISGSPLHPSCIHYTSTLYLHCSSMHCVVRKGLKQQTSHRLPGWLCEVWVWVWVWVLVDRKALLEGLLSAQTSRVAFEHLSTGAFAWFTCNPVFACHHLSFVSHADTQMPQEGEERRGIGEQNAHKNAQIQRVDIECCTKVSPLLGSTHALY